MAEETQEGVKTETTKTPEQIRADELRQGLPPGSIKPEESQKPEEKKENPKTEEAPAEVKPEDQVKPEFFEKVSKGRFKSQEDFEKHLTEHDELKKIADDYKVKVSELEKIKNENPFADREDLLRIDALARKFNTKDYGLVSRLNPEILKSMPPLELLKLRDTIENPDYHGKQSVLDRRLSKKYVVEKPENYDEMDPEEKKTYDDEAADREFDLNRDAKSARAELEAHWNGVEIPKRKSKEEIDQENEARNQRIAKEWVPTLTELKNSLRTIVSVIPKGKDQSEEITISIPEDKVVGLDEIFNIAHDHINKADLAASKENIEQLKASARAMFIAKNYEYIIAEIASKAAVKARSMSDEEWSKSTHNPSALRTESRKPEAQEETPEEKRARELREGK